MSSDAEDDLIHYGTPLEPLEEDEIPLKKPRLLEDQVVTDKQGRRRFHGAFTGGFSAGFFNTVGSLEGWTPSSFKSSKSKKQEIFQRKPEDFMDEEDQTEFGIAPVVLKAKRDYRNEVKREGSAFLDFSNFGSYVLQGLLKPARETVGMNLLKKMGWKPGQGVGPKLTKKEKKTTLKMRQKIYGCQLPGGSFEEEEEEENESDSEWKEIEFAPIDYEPIVCEARTNFCGLGYEGLDKTPVLSGSGPKSKESIALERKKKFGTQAFGVGAFEEEDEDIYARDDMSRYDFSLGNDQSDIKKSTEKNAILNGVLDGFVPETKKRIRKHYPLPALPRDYKPLHKVRKSRFDQPSPASEDKLKKLPRVSLEEPREEVLAAKKQREAVTKELISNVKIIEHKYKPFAHNVEKQERYENYLKLVKIGKKEHLSDLQPLSMTDWDREKEKVEFEKAAALFKPLSGGMEDRFLTASQPDDLSDPLAIVEKYHDESDDRARAAKMNMYGPLTRKTDDWTPCSLLCKRFNIPEPKKCISQTLEKKSGKSYFNLFDAIENLKESIEKPEIVGKPTSPEEKPHNKSGGLKPEEKLDETQNKTDLFKAIFLASDDEEDESEVTKGDKKEDLQESSTNIQDDLLYEDKLIYSKRNLSPPSGIFKNIDLDLLSGTKRTVTVEKESQKTDKVKLTDANPNLIYGPKIPEKVEAKPDYQINNRSDDDGIWVEKKIHEFKKHKKKDKKNKKASQKSKHKHKKHKR